MRINVIITGKRLVCNYNGKRLYYNNNWGRQGSGVGLLIPNVGSNPTDSTKRAPAKL